MTPPRLRASEADSHRAPLKHQWMKGHLWVRTKHKHQHVAGITICMLQTELAGCLGAMQLLVNNGSTTLQVSNRKYKEPYCGERNANTSLEQLDLFGASFPLGLSRVEHLPGAATPDPFQNHRVQHIVCSAR